MTFKVSSSSPFLGFTNQVNDHSIIQHRPTLVPQRVIQKTKLDEYSNVFNSEVYEEYYNQLRSFILDNFPIAILEST